MIIFFYCLSPPSGFAVASSPTEEDPQSLDQPPERISTLVKAEIEKHLKGKETVEQSLPQSVDIGPFHINTDTVRLALAKKHKDIVKALLEFLVLQLRKESEQVKTSLPHCMCTCSIRRTLHSGCSKLELPMSSVPRDTSKEIFLTSNFVKFKNCNSMV